MIVELGLGDADDFVPIGELRVDYRVAVPFQVGRFDAAWDGLPAVEEEDRHG